MKTPYLIQRLNFRQPARTEKGSFDDVLGCEYMGSAEFEWGALPKSLKKMTKNYDSLRVNNFNDLENYKGATLAIISSLDDANEYRVDYIDILASGKLNLKEQSRFKESITDLDYRGKKADGHFKCDVWWDVENHVIFTFGKNNAEKIIKAIEVTRDKKKDAGESEWY